MTSVGGVVCEVHHVVRCCISGGTLGVICDGGGGENLGYERRIPQVALKASKCVGVIIKGG